MSPCTIASIQVTVPASSPGGAQGSKKVGKVVKSKALGQDFGLCKVLQPVILHACAIYIYIYVCTNAYTCVYMCMVHSL